MWTNYEIMVDAKEYMLEAKVYNSPSLWGICNGRVSKLVIYDKDNGKTLWVYDRGWDGPEAPKEIVHKVMEVWPEVV